jgi:hypothetical protein
MPCENYREALTEAAATGSAPSHQLRSHLDACASCRTAFSEELQLFAAIDTGVRSAANAKVPTSFLPRIGARLEDAPVAQRRWMPFLIFAAASAAIVLTVIIAWRPRRAVNSTQATPTFSAASRETPGTPARREDSETSAVVATDGSQHILQRRKSAATGPALSAQLEVVVPPEEREAFARFVASMREPNNDALTLVSSAPEKKDDPMSVAPLQIAVLEVRRLEGPESEVPDSTQENQK